MIKTVRNTIFSFLAAALIVPATVLAQFREPTDNHGLSNIDSADAIVVKILNFFLSFLASLSILMIVVAGIMYITSAGNEGRVDTAKSWLTYAIVGLVVALLGFAIVAAVSSGLEAGGGSGRGGIL